MDKKIRKQIRLIAEAIDDEPKMFGIRVLPGKHPIDQLIMYCQQNMVKWDWNNNKFIKAMRDVYHSAGMTVPSDKEVLLKDLQKQSVQNPKLLNQLVAALGGMSRRTFMGLSAGAGAGLATGMIDFKGHEKSKAADWDGTLKPGQHYRVTYRNWKNQTRLFKDLVFSSSNGHMYWFMDRRMPRKVRNYTSRPGWGRHRISQTTKVQEIHWHQGAIARWSAYLNGQKPIRYDNRTGQAKYVRRDTWPLTTATLERKIQWHKDAITRLESISDVNELPYHCMTLQVENVVDITPFDGK